MLAAFPEALDDTPAQVYMRKGRLLLALRAVKHARALAGRDDPTAHCMLVRVCKALAELKAGAHDIAKDSSGETGCCSYMQRNRFVHALSVPTLCMQHVW